MINGMYLSTMGALTQTARHAAIANNLANTNTTGFKPDFTSYHSLPTESLLLPGRRLEVDEIMEKTGGGVWLEPTISDFTQGTFMETGSPLDLAIDDHLAGDAGIGFFLVRPAGSENGEIRYTRDGHFSVNGQGYLVNSNGDQVLNADGGPITLAGATEVAVNKDGSIVNVADNAIVGQVGIVRTTEPEKMKKVGQNLFSREDAQLVNSQLGVRSGTLEGSASNAIKEMVAMIEGHRTYEANMKFVGIQDETLGDTVRRVGALA